MLLRIRSHLRRHHAVHLAEAELSFSALLCVIVSLAAAGATPAYVRLDATAARSRPLTVMARLDALRPAGLQKADVPAEEQAVIRLQDLAPDAARLWNASNPIAKAPNPAAKPFNLDAEGVLDEARAADCMTAAVYYEAGYESAEGQRAVAQVVLNRLRNPLFPKSVCGVVFQGSDRPSGCQFTFTCDGSLSRHPQPEAWERARQVAEAALHGYVMKKVGNATHYHADYVAPYWSPSLVKVAVVGQHIFYRWTGGLGLPPAFGGRYAGGEQQGLQIATLDKLSHLAPASAAAPVEEAASAQAQPAAVDPVETAKPAPAAQAAQDLVTADKLAQNSAAILKPEELDWQGRPRQKGRSRIASPSAGPGGL